MAYQPCPGTQTLSAGTVEQLAADIERRPEDISFVVVAYHSKGGLDYRMTQARVDELIATGDESFDLNDVEFRLEVSAGSCNDTADGCHIHYKKVRRLYHGQYIYCCVRC